MFTNEFCTNSERDALTTDWTTLLPTSPAENDTCAPLVVAHPRGRGRSSPGPRAWGARLRRRIAEMERQRDVEEEKKLARERWMAFIVHDLKTPVCSADLHAQVLLRDLALPSVVRDSATQIRSSTQRAALMLSNMLDVARADAGFLSLTRERFAVASTVAEVFATLAAHADAHEVTLSSSVSTSLQIDADEPLVRRMLTNLVDNAIRHSPPRSVVAVSAASSDTGSTLRVADRGRGVPESLRATIFARFSGGEASSSRHGHGLGLAFCKAAALAHGGDVWFESSNTGTSFCVRLP